MQMKKKIYNLPVYTYFIILTVLIVILFPREGKFRYIFTEGKPWKYSLLTAPFDFPIYKSQSDFKKEQDSLARSFRPYFLLDKEMGKNQMAKFKKDRSNIPEINNVYANYIIKSLQTIYERGIVSVSDYEFLQTNNYSDFMLIKDNVVSEYDVSLLFTVRSAYSFILDNAPPDMDIAILHTASLENYLSENMK
jgi:hypothetical protein